MFSPRDFVVRFERIVLSGQEHGLMACYRMNCASEFIEDYEVCTTHSIAYCDSARFSLRVLSAAVFINETVW